MKKKVDASDKGSADRHCSAVRRTSRPLLVLIFFFFSILSSSFCDVLTRIYATGTSCDISHYQRRPCARKDSFVLSNDQRTEIPQNSLHLEEQFDPPKETVASRQNKIKGIRRQQFSFLAVRQRLWGFTTFSPRIMRIESISQLC